MITIQESKIENVASEQLDRGHKWIVTTTDGDEVTYSHRTNRNSLHPTIDVRINGACWVHMEHVTRSAAEHAPVVQEYESMVNMLAGLTVTRDRTAYEKKQSEAAETAKRIFN